jgi:ribokinase
MLTETIATPSVLIVGSINSDLILRAPRLPSPGESLIGADYKRVAGGKGANQAVAVARLGATATLVGKTGTDSEGETLRAQLCTEGVRTDFVSCCGTPTGLAVITIDSRGQNSIIIVSGANNQVCDEDVQAALSAGTYDALMLQFEIPTQTVIAACRFAKEHGVPIIVDAGPAQAFPLEELQGIDILTPNETELTALTGIDPGTVQDAQRAAEILLRRSHAKAIVLKLGSRGALLYDQNGAYEYFPAYSIEAVDATAAGDAFTAAMTVEYVRSGDLGRAVRLGNAAGALAAMNLGAQPSLPTAIALAEFCERQRTYVS